MSEMLKKVCVLREFERVRGLYNVKKVVLKMLIAEENLLKTLLPILMLFFVFTDNVNCYLDVCDRDEWRGAGGRVVLHDRARAGPGVRRRGRHVVLHRHHASSRHVHRRSC